MEQSLICGSVKVIEGYVIPIHLTELLCLMTGSVSKIKIYYIS